MSRRGRSSRERLLERGPEGRRERARYLTPSFAIGWIAFVAVAVAVLGALSAYLLDKDAFGSFGNALWWSIVTVGTVGYGDLVPTNPEGRIVAAVMIVWTMAFFPLLIGYVTAILVGRLQRESRDAEGRETSAHRAEVLERLRLLEERLGRLEERGR